MPRNRMIKPEFWSDEKIGRLSMGGRLLFISLWNFADDYGVISASPRRRLGESFENDESVSEKDVIKWLDQIEETGLIYRFWAEEKEWFYITKWENHQKIDRKSQRKNPEFPGFKEDSTSDSTTVSRDTRKTLASDSDAKEKEKVKGERERRKEKEKEQAEAFEYFWKKTRYPKRAQDTKGDMKKKFVKLLNSGFSKDDILLSSDTFSEVNKDNEFPIGLRKFLEPETVQQYLEGDFVSGRKETAMDVAQRIIQED